MMTARDFPEALLLDFGGVIVNSTTPEGWQPRVADRLLSLTGVAGMPSRERVIADITAGAIAAGLWRNAMSRPRHPNELDQTTYVMDFIAADWPDEARAIVGAHVPALCYFISSAKEERELRDGIVALLSWCAEIELPVAIVSNAMCGAVHRDYLEHAGLADRFIAELYSDEVGLRKPNPDFLVLGAEAVGRTIDECWYVGDHADRDVLCGVRAGVGANVLMPSPGSSPKPYTVPVEPDVTVASPRELLTHLRSLHDHR